MESASGETDGAKAPLKLSLSFGSQWIRCVECSRRILPSFRVLFYYNKVRTMKHCQLFKVPQAVTCF